MSVLTVIVPIYNVENYIVDCVRSLNEQSFTDFKVIFVNDETKDRSMEVLNQYLQNEDIGFQWQILHNEQNSGLSASRNNALAIVDTEFVMFLDSDDFIDNCMLETIFVANADTTISVDILCYGMKLYNGQQYLDTKRIKGTEVAFFSPKQAILSLFDHGNIDASACSKIFKVSLFKDGNIRFPEGVYFEDVPTVVRLMDKAKQIALLPHNFYAYRYQRTGSIMNTVSKKHLLDNIRLMDDLESYFSDNKEILLSREFNTDKFFNVVYELVKLTKVRHGLSNQGVSIFAVLQDRLTLYYSRLKQIKALNPKIIILYHYFSGGEQYLKWNYFKLGVVVRLLSFYRKLKK